MAIIFLLLFLLFDSINYACSMDENDYARYINPGESKQQRPKNPFILQKSPSIEIDLDSDGQLESIQWEKVDGLDIFSIRGSNQKLLWEKTITPNGSNSYLGKLELKQINRDWRLLIFYYFEGEGAVPYYKRVGKLFLLSFPIKNNLKNLGAMQWTPYVYGDHLLPVDSREKRDFKVEYVDLTGDGIGEILIQQGLINRVLQWNSLSNRWSLAPENFYTPYALNITIP